MGSTDAQLEPARHGQFYHGHAHTNSHSHSHHSSTHSIVGRAFAADHLASSLTDDAADDYAPAASPPGSDHFGSPPRLAPMRSRPRGESDLGRPTLKNPYVANGYPFSPVSPVAEHPTSPRDTLLSEALTALLIPLPFTLASLAYPRPLARNDEFFSGAFNRLQVDPSNSPLIHACVLSSGALLLVGVLGTIQLHMSERVLDRRKRESSRSVSFLDGITAGDIISRLSLIMPFYAAMQLGGARPGLVLLTSIASGLAGSKTAEILYKVQDNKWTVGVLLLSLLLDFYTSRATEEIYSLFFGYLALALSVFVAPPPLSGLGMFAANEPDNKSSNQSSGSPLIGTFQATNITLGCGALLAVGTVIASSILTLAPPVSSVALVFTTLAISATAAAIFFAEPEVFKPNGIVGVSAGCASVALSEIIQPARARLFVLGSLLTVAAVVVDKRSLASGGAEHAHNARRHNHAKKDYSKLTRFLLTKFEPGSIVHDILVEKDSRRIAYFGSLNLAFMMVQFFYGFVTGSLGLLTDSIHMFFDCAGLAVGLAAAVMSKWSPSLGFPYGYGKVETLSGFANGIFLMLVSVEIIVEAIGKLYSGGELRRLDELLIVSVCGFIVNIVGLLAFGHAHHGHSHDHSHGHSHGHDHSHGHSHGHEHKHSHTPEILSLDMPLSATSPASPTAAIVHHHHDHDNENMQGIYLHVMADALGSVAVIISTILIKYQGWNGWDALGGIIVSVLILLTAIPLVKSTGLKLLLTLPDDVEYKVRATLQEIHGLRGVVGYAVPKFWMEDAGAAIAEDHAHAQAHAHAHSHGHSHSHSHAHDHDHSHGADGCNGHDHDHHDHDHDHDHGHSHTHKHDDEDHVHAGQPRILGVIHIIAAPTAELDDVRERVTQFLKGKGMEVLVHVEKEADGNCWCGGGVKTT